MNTKELKGKVIKFTCPIHKTVLQQENNLPHSFFGVVTGVLSIPVSYDTEMHFTCLGYLQISNTVYLEKFNPELRLTCIVSEDGEVYIETCVYILQRQFLLRGERKSLGKINIYGEIFPYVYSPDNFFLSSTGIYKASKESVNPDCIYYSGEPGLGLKCAVNPTIPCKDCRDYTSKLMNPLL